MGEYKRKKRRGQPVKNAFSRVVGEIKNGILVKVVSSDRHMLRVPLGWAWDVAILKKARKAGVERTLIIDQGANKTYEALLSDFEHFGIGIDRGYGRQICLPLKYWQFSESEKSPVEQHENCCGEYSARLCGFQLEEL